MHSWSEVCTLREGAAEVPATWAQGRAVFGGLVAGLGIEALASKVPVDRGLRSVLVDFVGPVAPGPVQVQAEILRHGRALSQGEARVVQDGQVRAVLLAAFGAPRSTRMPRLEAPPPPAVPDPDDLLVFPYVEGLTPTFTQHYDYRWASHDLPFTGGTRARIDGWVRPKDTRPVHAPGLLALIDAWPAPVLSLLRRPAPASTVTWMVDVVAPLPASGVAPQAWWRFEAEAVAAADGYAEVEGRLWGPGGHLVATSRQLIAEFS